MVEILREHWLAYSLVAVFYILFGHICAAIIYDNPLKVPQTKHGRLLYFEFIGFLWLPYSILIVIWWLIKTLLITIWKIIWFIILLIESFIRYIYNFYKHHVLKIAKQDDTSKDPHREPDKTDPKSDQKNNPNNPKTINLDKILIWIIQTIDTFFKVGSPLSIIFEKVVKEIIHNLEQKSQTYTKANITEVVDLVFAKFKLDNQALRDETINVITDHLITKGLAVKDLTVTMFIEAWRKKIEKNS